MRGIKHDKEQLRCSFCGKPQNEVEKLIAGPSVYICNECVDICNVIITDDRRTKSEDSALTTDESEDIMTSAADSANLILRLYELRREPKMREARDWFARFDPQTAQDIMQAVMNEETSAYYRMVASYWDMASSFVINNAIDEQMFTDANMEHIFVFSKIEPFLAELRTMVNAPKMLKNLETLVMRQPDARASLDAMRERSRRMAQMRAASK